MMNEKMDKIPEESYGQVITVEGIAFNAKGGACIKLNKGEIVYIKGKIDWDDNYLQKKVVLTGKIKLEKMIPNSVVEKNGSISTGAVGKQLIIEEVTKLEIVE